MDFDNPNAGVMNEMPPQDLIQNEMARPTFENSGSQDYFKRDLSPRSMAGLLVVMLEAAYAASQNEKNLRIEDAKQFAADHIADKYENGCVVDCPPELVSSVRDAQRVLHNDGQSFGTFEFTEQSNGHLIIGCDKHDSDKLAGLVKEVYLEVGSYNVDKTILEQAKKSDGQIVTTDSRSFTTAQTYFMLPELSHAHLLYCVDPEKETLSVLVNDKADKAKLNDVIRRTAADMSTTDFAHYDHVFGSRGKALQQIFETVEERNKNKETIYISSAEHAEGKYTFLKITPETVSLVTGTTKENEVEHDIKDVSDINNLRAQLTKFQEPVILTEEEFNDRDKMEIFDQRRLIVYGEKPQREDDKALTDFLKCKSIRDIDFTQRDMRAVWNDIKEAVITSDNIDDIPAFDKVKNMSYDDYAVTLSRFCNARVNLNGVFKEAARQDKDIEHPEEAR